MFRKSLRLYSKRGRRSYPSPHQQQKFQTFNPWYFISFDLRIIDQAGSVHKDNTSFSELYASYLGTKHKKDKDITLQNAHTDVEYIKALENMIKSTNPRNVKIILILDQISSRRLCCRPRKSRICFINIERGHILCCL
jgi:hypothetical protein